MYYEGNDLGELDGELLNDILVKYLEDKKFSQNLKNKQNEINLKVDEKIGSEKNIRLKSKIFKFIKLTKVRYIFIVKPQKIVRPEFKQILLSAKNLVKQNDSKLYFVYLPEYARYKTSFDNTNYLKIKKILSELDIPLIDLHTEIFIKEKDPTDLYPFNSFGHYNKLGYKKVADKIYQLTQ
jgi:hypothetical protein